MQNPGGENAPCLDCLTVISAHKADAEGDVKMEAEASGSIRFFPGHRPEKRLLITSPSHMTLYQKILQLDILLSAIVV